MANKKITDLLDGAITGSSKLFIGDENGTLFKGTYNDLLAFLFSKGIKIPDGKSFDGTITTGTAGGNVTKQLSGFKWYINSVLYEPIGSSIAFQLVPNASFNYAVLIQGNSLGQYALKPSTPASTITIPSPDANNVALQVFIVTTSGIVTNTTVLLAAYAKLNELNTGDLDITGTYKKNGNPIAFLTPLTFTQANLVSTGDSFFKLPLVLTGSQIVLGVKVAITSGSTYQKPASDWINNEIINFDTNVAQTITVITS